MGLDLYSPRMGPPSLGIPLLGGDEPWNKVRKALCRGNLPEPCSEPGQNLPKFALHR